MLSLMQRKKPLAVRRTPDDVRIYAIGDVHGRMDVLDALLRGVREDIVGGPQPVLVMLGDYVDRGPASRQVLDRLVSLQQDATLATRFIRGNHDDAMLKFLAEPSTGAGWYAFGGRETLLSYGVDIPVLSDEPEGWLALRDAATAVIPPEHVRLLEGLESSAEYGDYFFTHAGVRPGVPLADQSPDDLMWIRRPFLNGSASFPKTIVHGHSPEKEAFVSDRRIGLDTGAYATGRLTALVLEGAERRLIQASACSGRIKVERVELASTASQPTV